MKYIYRKNWFTVVELVVVMTILVILATLSFLTVSEYPKDSRDAVRVSNLNDIKSIIDLHVSNTWEYPAPTNSSFEVDGSWVVWAVWDFGSWVISQLNTVKNLPLDPNTKTPYKYALSEDGRSYKVITHLEWKWEDYSIWNTMADWDKDLVTCTDLPLSWVDILNSAFSSTIASTPKTKAEWCSLKAIDIVNKSIGYLPKEFFYLTNLTNVRIYWAWIPEIPAEIWNLRNLKSLSLWGNSIESLPAEIGKLTKLENLSLGYNVSLSSLPEEIWNLVNLQRIWLNHTDLTSGLPSGFSNLDNLTYLSMYTSCVPTFPLEILDLESLNYLVLNNDSTHCSNLIPNLPDALVNLSNQLSGIDFRWQSNLWGVARFMDYANTWPFSQSNVTETWKTMTFTWNPSTRVFSIATNSTITN